MYLLVLACPFFSFFFLSFFGFFFGRSGSLYISLSFHFLTFFIILFMFYEIVFCYSPVYIFLWDWFFIDVFSISFGLYFDSLTCFMLFIIIFISLVVQFYSLGYMMHDPHIIRFFSFLSLFSFFMIVLVTADNFLQLFFGWEGVGLCSFLLISFWYTRFLAVKAAVKAMIVNRIADVFFLFAIVFIFLIFKTLNFNLIFNLFFFLIDDYFFFLFIYVKKVDFICFLLFVAAIGKSAQIGFHTWLPDAMEGPTPVSALLHAATMVTAGVFLILRCSFLFEFSDNVLLLIYLFGGVTCFFSGIIGAFVFDVKKIIAYSTCSQLGYMFFSAGVSKYEICFFHLFNHAFFKALLFLSAGALIHSLKDEQDIRKMGNLVNFLPFTYICFFLGSLAIMGFPFLTGFYSKDIILESAYSRFIVDGFFIYCLMVFSSFFTCVYSIRLLLFVFFNFYNGFSFEISESNFFILWSMFLLCFCSIFVGFLFSDLFLGLGNFFFNDSFFVLVSHSFFLDIDVMPVFFKDLPIFFSIFGFFWGWFFYEFLVKLFSDKDLDKDLFWVRKFFFPFFKKLSIFFISAFFFNFFFNFFFRFFYFYSYEIFVKTFEKGVLDFFSFYGFYKCFVYFYKNFFSFYVSLIPLYFFIFYIFLYFFFTLICFFYNFVIVFFFLFIFIFLN